MPSSLRNFKNVLKEINVLTTEKQVNNLILQEFDSIISDINEQIDISDDNIKRLTENKKNIKTLESKMSKYRAKGWIYTFLPIIFALIFSPIILNVLTPIASVMLICSLSVILSAFASTIGFEDYNCAKMKLKEIPKINSELQLEYKNNSNLKYDLSFYIYKRKELKQEQNNIFDNIQNLLNISKEQPNQRQTFFENDIYSELISNKVKVKK